MKKLMYIIYLCILTTLVVCTKLNVISSSVTAIILIVIGLAILLLCFGSYYPTQTIRLETQQSLYDKLDSRNDPILIKPFLLLFIPVVLMFLINQYL